MKKLSLSRLALTYAGCFLGAGYVSGQELWQFFGAFGFWGLVGLILALSGMLAFSCLLISLAQKTGIVEMDRIVVPWEIAWLRGISAVLQVVFLFGVAVIMAAGAGALLHQLFAIPVWVGCGIFALAVILIFSVFQYKTGLGNTAVFCVSLTAAVSLWGNLIRRQFRGEEEP